MKELPKFGAGCSVEDASACEILSCIVARNEKDEILGNDVLVDVFSELDGARGFLSE